MKDTGNAKPAWLVSAEQRQQAAWDAYNCASEAMLDGAVPYESVARLERAAYAADADLEKAIQQHGNAQECNCVLPWQHCPACVQAARLAYDNDGFPF